MSFFALTDSDGDTIEVISGGLRRGDFVGDGHVRVRVSYEGSDTGPAVDLDGAALDKLMAELQRRRAAMPGERDRSAEPCVQIEPGSVVVLRGSMHSPKMTVESINEDTAALVWVGPDQRFQNVSIRLAALQVVS